MDHSQQWLCKDTEDSQFCINEGKTWLQPHSSGFSHIHLSVLQSRSLLAGPHPFGIFMRCL